VILYSDYIEEIAEWLRGIGVTVDYVWDGKLPPHVMAQYEDRDPSIKMLARLSARDALLALAHEAGHHLGYLIDRKPHSYQRERQAYVYGWHVLQWFAAPVTRAEWIESCRESEAARRYVIAEQRRASV
jgi:hypothetical protein